MIVPLYLKTVVTQGSGATLEIVGAVAGVLGGLAATALMRVYRSNTTGKSVTAAGWGLRRSLGHGHRRSCRLFVWSESLVPGSARALACDESRADGCHHDGLIFMAVAMLLTRTIGLAIRARAVSTANVEPASTALVNV